MFILNCDWCIWFVFIWETLGYDQLICINMYRISIISPAKEDVGDAEMNLNEERILGPGMIEEGEEESLSAADLGNNSVSNESNCYI